MAKMISLTSVPVAAAAATLKHSFPLAPVIGLIVMCYACVVTSLPP